MMKKQNKIYLGIGIVAIILIVAIAMFSMPKGEETIKIGFMGPLSGDAVDYGMGAKTGYELALQEINSKGGINGKPIEIIYEDSKCEAKTAIDAVNKLVNVDKVNIILGGVCSSETLAAGPIAEQNKVIMLSSISTNYQITDLGDYIFRNVPSDALQGKKAAELTYDEGYRKVAIIYIGDNDYGLGLKEVFEKRFEELGGSVILSETFLGGDTDFRTQLTKIKNSDAEAIFLAGMLKESALILNQAKELNIDKQFITTESVKDSSFFDIVGDSAEGLLLTSMKELESQKAIEFKQKYVESFEKEPKFYSDYAYDALNLLSEVMRDCQNPNDANCIKEGLYDISYDGATGMNDFDNNGDVSKEFSTYKVLNQEFVPHNK